jgi:hypothetical protein
MFCYVDVLHDHVPYCLLSILFMYWIYVLYSTEVMNLLILVLESQNEVE